MSKKLKNKRVTENQRKKLRKILKKIGVPQYRLALRLKIDPQQFSRLLRGWWLVPTEFWSKIEKALGKRDGYFTGGK